MRLIAVIIAVLALASGCGGDGGGGDENGCGGGTTTATQLTVDDCLGGRGFGLNPTAGGGVSAVTPRGVAFTIAFFPTPDGARAAARKAGAGAVAVDTGVVKVSAKGKLSEADLDAIEECIPG
jgi:hypothetical protein